MLRSVGKTALHPRPPRLPRWALPPFRLLYEVHFGVIVFFRLILTLFYRHPLFQARCASVGKNLTIDGLPIVTGHIEIHIGNNVWIGGQVSIISGSALDRPRLIIQDHAEVGWNVIFSINREIIIEEHARVSFDCRLMDSDGHPREADLRAANGKVKPGDIRPIRICRNAWIGNGTHIMKGVTIGEGAIVAANSVVISDIPPYSLAMGNPAEVYFKNFGQPSKRAATDSA
jgi:acetyltransferase-like isoleucine patch superfamily enzyme